jgi:hypothetical protein
MTLLAARDGLGARGIQRQGTARLKSRETAAESINVSPVSVRKLP